MAERRTDRAGMLVEGSGPVALALLAWLGRQGLGPGQVAWRADDRPLPAALAARPIALSAGSWQILRRIVPSLRAAPITRVEVSVAGHAGRLRLSAADMAVPALGHVVRYGHLHERLRSACAALGHAPAAAGDDAETAVRVLADGVPGGGDSLDFAQDALLAELHFPDAPGGVAFERFLPGGPLAVLPLPEPGRHAIVWCDAPAASARRAAMPDPALCDELARALGIDPGALTLASTRTTTPLVRHLRRLTVDGATVAIGNAAQTLHPVAGQGLNLGLRDAFELASRIGEHAARGGDARAAIAAFPRSRALDRRATVALTDSLARAFTSPLVRGPAAIALAALDLSAPARRGLAGVFMYGLRRPFR